MGGFGLRFNKDGSRLALGSHTGTCCMFDTDVRWAVEEDPKLLWESPPFFEGRPATRIEISPDESTIAVADMNTVAFLDFDSGSVLGLVKGAHSIDAFDGELGPITGMSWLSNSIELATSGSDRAVRIWRNPKLW